MMSHCHVLQYLVILTSCVTEIVRAMTFVINQGWAMYWGTSRWSTMEIMVTILVLSMYEFVLVCISEHEKYLQMIIASMEDA